jgi:twitching motility two-component system response regulator PilH
LARKVLLADDSVTAQNMGRRILVDAGYEVVTVNNGSSALKKVAESKPDLIVLDVYMPGYGGLEVCQRIRESQETARIPILLTVGKLEPFKAEEATRVRADAFIVKPFEASELLTALTKLEDKIVPQPGSRRSGRAKAEDAAYAKDFGDIETGWKNRLKIPPPHQPRPASSPAEAHRETLADESAVAEAEVKGKLDEPQDTHPNVSADTTKEQPQAAGETADFAVQAEPSPTEEINNVQAAAPQLESRPEIAAQDVSQPRHEDEVAAALASLVPSNGHGSESAPFEPELVPATMVAAITTQQFSGPRWIAHEVTLNDDESSLILEQEMHKAFAALAAADAARMSLSAPSDPSSPYTSLAPQEETAQGSSDPVVDEPTSFASMSDKQELVAVPVPANEVAPEQPTQAPAEVEAAQEQDVDGGQASAPAYAAYAAAAAAGATTTSHEPNLESSVASQPSANSAPPSAPTESKHDAELAAAWASWKQVRDSVSAPEFTSQIADAAATGIDEISEKAVMNPESETAASSGEENGAIDSIVDSVLAELKPKLVEEIAKKMKKKPKK